MGIRSKFPYTRHLKTGARASVLEYNEHRWEAPRYRKTKMTKGKEEHGRIGEGGWEQLNGIKGSAGD